MDLTQEVAFGGEHLKGKTNADVEVVSIGTATTPFMIPSMFTTFSNMTELMIILSMLESIKIPDFVQLRRLTVDLNRISRIEKGTLNNQKSLRSFMAIRAGIQSIDEDAFEGLDQLTSLFLPNNGITEIAPKTFHHLPNLVTLSLDNNFLIRIDDGLFSMNTNLKRIYIANNQINEISPIFSRAFLENLERFDMKENACANRLFVIEDQTSLVVMNSVLRTCYNNFNGGVAEKREIKSQFQGPMAFYDEFGNIVGRIQ